MIMIANIIANALLSINMVYGIKSREKNKQREKNYENHRPA